MGPVHGTSETHSFTTPMSKAVVSGFAFHGSSRGQASVTLVHRVLIERATPAQSIFNGCREQASANRVMCHGRSRPRAS